jgi:EAL domain-containing protein (putative c-di-GMP-specific phosphodiesterase class I)/CheY-like chemotaxis protein
MDPIQVLIADDDPGVLEVLTSIVTADPAMDVIGAASGAEEAIDLARDLRPDVALVDVRMPGGGGPRAARGIRRGSPHTAVIALSAIEDPVAVVAMVEAGASGFVSKADTTLEIVRAIRRCREGGTSLSARIRDGAAEALASRLASGTRIAGPRNMSRDRIRNLVEDGDGVHMVFQPIVDLRGGTIVAVEALARFLTRPRRSPDAWFADAREHGLGIDLEMVAMRRALTYLPKLPPGVRMALNLSPDALGSVQFALLLEEEPLDRLILEVTEQTRIVDQQRLERALEPWRDGGALVAVDDVGAGFSGLNRVVELRPDFVKLDIALTRGIDSDHLRQSLVAMLGSFARETGAALIAEGLETDTQIAKLLEMDVRLGQGFRLGRPGPLPFPDGSGRLRWGGRHAFTPGRTEGRVEETVHVPDVGPKRDGAS